MVTDMSLASCLSQAGEMENGDGEALANRAASLFWAWKVLSLSVHNARKIEVFWGTELDWPGPVRSGTASRQAPSEDVRSQQISQ